MFLVYLALAGYYVPQNKTMQWNNEKKTMNSIKGVDIYIMPRHQFNLNSPVNLLQQKINEKLVARSVYASIRQIENH